MAMDRKQRSQLIKDTLKPLVGTRVLCPALGTYVYITSKGVSETAYWASKDDSSTRVAQNLPYYLKRARLVGSHQPKDNKQRKIFHFVCVFELHYNGVKIIVGRNNRHLTLHYCIRNTQ